MRYPDRFVGDLREVELEGEGYFRVARNEKMPFVVRTKRLDVQVLGTRFDVKSYSTDEIAVSYTHLDVYKRQVLNSDTVIGDFMNPDTSS